MFYPFGVGSLQKSRYKFQSNLISDNQIAKISGHYWLTGGAAGVLGHIEVLATQAPAWGVTPQQFLEDHVVLRIESASSLTARQSPLPLYHNLQPYG